MILGPVIVVGGGGHSKVVIGILHRSAADVIGYTDPMDRGSLLGVRRLGDDDVLPEVRAAAPAAAAVIGVGKIDASRARRTLLADLDAMGFTLPVVTSPTSVIGEDVRLGAASLVCDGAVVNVGVTVGSGCILNTNSTIEHDCRLAENVHVAPGAVLSGGVSVGEDTFIGAGAVVLQQVTIGSGCLIGAGSIVVDNITKPGVYVGSPARRLR